MTRRSNRLEEILNEESCLICRNPVQESYGGSLCERCDEIYGDMDDTIFWHDRDYPHRDAG